jgi:hypothetical protein
MRRLVMVHPMASRSCEFVREVSEAHVEGSIGEAVVSTELAFLGGVSLIDNSMLADHLQEENAAISPCMKRYSTYISLGRPLSIPRGSQKLNR